MNSTTALSISQNRLARLIAWAGLWLQAFAAMLITLTAADAPAARRALARMARFVSHLVVVRVAMRAHPRRQRPRWRAAIARAGMARTMVGAALRQRLRGRDLAARFFAILRVMRDLDAVVARQAKRLARGLTRLRPILPVLEFFSAKLVSVTPDVVQADSS